MINFIVALVSETNLVHGLFLVYFVYFIHNLYMFFLTSSGQSSGGTTVCRMHPAYHTVSYTE